MLEGTLVAFSQGAPDHKVRHHPSARGRMLLLACMFSALTLAGCASRSDRAPVVDHSAGGPAASMPAVGTYRVQPGDTLYKIARQHGMEVERLMQLNNISDPTQLAIGQALRLDGGTPMPAGGGAQTSPVTVAGSAPAKAESSTPVRASDASLISWGWPASGKLIQQFNANTKGIDFEGALGDPVLAAAEGKVMYAGNGVRGLGNLILLGHSNGFITAYAHNDSLLVKTGESVKKGAKIATIGQSDTTSPRLHFEIRRKGTPVNPLSYLPAR